MAFSNLEKAMAAVIGLDIARPGTSRAAAKRAVALLGRTAVPAARTAARVNPYAAAGLTGLAQIYDKTDDPYEKYRYDMAYLDKLSPLLDAQLLLRSVWNTAIARWDHRSGKIKLLNIEAGKSAYAVCVTCHGAENPEAGLDLRSLQSLVRGSKSGPVIVEGFSDKSVLIRKISSRMMPPAGSTARAPGRP